MKRRVVNATCSRNECIAAREEDGVWSGWVRVIPFLPRDIEATSAVIGNYWRVLEAATDRGQRTHPDHAPASVGVASR